MGYRIQIVGIHSRACLSANPTESRGSLATDVDALMNVNLRIVIRTNKGDRTAANSAGAIRVPRQAGGAPAQDTALRAAKVMSSYNNMKNHGQPY